MYRCGALQTKLCDGGSLWPHHRKGNGAGYQVHLEGCSPLGSPGCQCKHSGFCQAQHHPMVWTTVAEAGQVPEEC